MGKSEKIPLTEEQKVQVIALLIEGKALTEIKAIMAKAALPRKSATIDTISEYVNSVMTEELMLTVNKARKKKNDERQRQRTREKALKIYRLATVEGMTRQEACKKLGVSTGWLGEVLREGLTVAEYKKIKSLWSFYPQRGYSSEQPCWTCKNACGGCSWSRDFTPIKGWDAKPSQKTSNGVTTNTYCIKSCPQYEKEPPRKNYTDRERDDILIKFWSAWDEAVGDGVAEGLIAKLLGKDKRKHITARAFAKECDKYKEEKKRTAQRVKPMPVSDTVKGLPSEYKSYNELMREYEELKGRSGD